MGVFGPLLSSFEDVHIAGNCALTFTQVIRGFDTYELIFLVWFLENGTPVSRFQTVLEYEFEGKIHKYHPDFEVKNVLYEVKGYWTKQSEAKRDQHPEVVVMDKYDILSMKEECSLKGKSLSDLVALYEPRPR